MIRLLWFLSLSSLTASPEWLLVWSDEFEEAGQPDPVKWSYDTHSNDGQRQHYTVGRSENARVEDGHLVIEARRDFHGGHEYTSARLFTRDTASWTYGRIEVRAKIPTGRGMFPAIWMLGEAIGEVGWPACGEIDIMENWGLAPETIACTIHTHNYNHIDGTQSGSSINVPGAWEDFHVYALEWYPDRLDLYVDDTRVHTFEDDGGGPPSWPFFDPHFLILNVAIHPWFGPQSGIDDSIFPQQMRVDYVRVYEEKTTGPYQLETEVAGVGEVLVSPRMETYPEGTEVTLLANPGMGSAFFRWHGADLPPDRAITVEMNRDLNLRAVFRTPGELLSNGDFTHYRTDWDGPLAIPGHQGQGDTSSVERQLELTYISGELAGENVFMVHTGVELEQGVSYRISLEATAEEGGPLRAGVGHAEVGSTLYHTFDAELSSDWQTFSSEFEMTAPSDPECVLILFNGGISSRLLIDNVSLSRIPDPRPSPFDAWKTAHDVTSWDEGDDSDGDGMPLLLEFAYNRDPLWRDVPLLRPSISGDTLNLNLPRLAAPPSDVTVKVEASADLQIWTAVDADNLPAADPSTQFFRVSADRP